MKREEEEDELFLDGFGFVVDLWVVFERAGRDSEAEERRLFNGDVVVGVVGEEGRRCSFEGLSWETGTVRLEEVDGLMELWRRVLLEGEGESEGEDEDEVVVEVEDLCFFFSAADFEGLKIRGSMRNKKEPLPEPWLCALRTTPN